jgi:glycosyltransferase involved in cell wall biosynthesis
MKILHITLGFYPALSWGGPVKSVHLLAKEQVRQGHQVTVLCSAMKDKHTDLQSKTFEKNIKGIRVLYLKTWRWRHWPGTLGPFWMPELRKYLEALLPIMDIVHIHGYRTTLSLTAASMCRRLDVPWVVQPRGGMRAVVSNTKVKHIYDMLIGRHEVNGLGAVIALQTAEKKQAVRIGVPKDRIHIVPNGIDFESYTLPPKGIFRTQWGIPSKVPLIIFVGRINPVKGVDILVEAFARFANNPSSYLAIIGPDDGYLSDIKNQVHSLGLTSNVIFTDVLMDESLWAAYQDADLFVLPCRSDTFPRVILESAFFGLPVVTTTGCEIADIVDTQMGIVVPTEADSISASIDFLLTNKEIARKYGERGREIVRAEYSTSAIADQIEELYQLVLSGHFASKEDIIAENLDLKVRNPI